jgi:hypothetical protein
MLRFTVINKLSTEISALLQGWCINRCRYKRVRLYTRTLNSGHSVGWRAEAPIIVAGKKVSGCNRASNSLLTVVHRGLCGENTVDIFVYLRSIKTCLHEENSQYFWSTLGQLNEYVYVFSFCMSWGFLSFLFLSRTSLFPLIIGV